MPRPEIRPFKSQAGARTDCPSSLTTPATLSSNLGLRHTCFGVPPSYVSLELHREGASLRSVQPFHSDGPSTNALGQVELRDSYHRRESVSQRRCQDTGHGPSLAKATTTTEAPVSLIGCQSLSSVHRAQPMRSSWRITHKAQRLPPVVAI